jgi:(2Fe-2S) ferredoxin
MGISSTLDLRVNRSGCLGRCEHGPTAVVYPDGVWYHYETRADLDEILEEHIGNGRVVERLRIRSG